MILAAGVWVTKEGINMLSFFVTLDSSLTPYYILPPLKKIWIPSIKNFIFIPFFPFVLVFVGIPLIPNTFTLDDLGSGGSPDCSWDP